MPKRLLKRCAQSRSKSRRKSMVIDDVNDDTGGSSNEMSIKEPGKNMRYMRTNHDNEIERLLIYNSNMLLYSVDHSHLPAFNASMWPHENTDMLTNYPSCAFSVPRPVFVADNQCKKIDICYKRPMKNFAFKSHLRHSRSTYQTALKNNKNMRNSLKDEIYHYSVFDIAERVHMQPDPFFQSSYDYYFTGGNLCVLPNKPNIIHTGGETLQEIFASEFPIVNEYGDTDSLRNVASLKKNENSEIFEIQPLITSPGNNRQNSFVARQRNLVSLNFVQNGEIKPITHFRTKTTPFVSCAQSERNIKNIIITTMKQHVRLYDLNSCQPKFVTIFEISPKEPQISWNTIKPWREDTFIYANEKKFFMVDIRTSPKEWLSEVLFNDDSLICDHISALQPSGFNNLFYVATNHKLQCMDIRQLKKCSLSGLEGGISRWTHQLRYAPLMIDTLRASQNEYIALSSPIAGDLHICELSRELKDDNIRLEPSLLKHRHIYSSYCLPYQPPTLFEAYDNARLSGKCLNPEANMMARLKCCITGMKFVKSSVNNLDCALGLLVTSNSNGDVFAQTLSKREDKKTEERCNRQSDEIMTNFEHKICEKTNFALNYTNIKNMKGLRKVFLCKKLSSDDKYSLDAMDNEYNEEDTPANNATDGQQKKCPKRFALGRWQKSLSTLHSYKDALVSDLLSIWDIDMEEERNICIENLSYNVKNDPVEKVENWMQTHIDPNPPMLSIPFQDISSYVDNTQTSIDFENAIHSTQISDSAAQNATNLDSSRKPATGNLKNKNKNKKYVKGF